MATIAICITLPEDILERLDKRVEKIGSGAKRSGWIKEAIEEKLAKKVKA